MVPAYFLKHELVIANLKHGRYFTPCEQNDSLHF